MNPRARVWVAAVTIVGVGCSGGAGAARPRERVPASVTLVADWSHALNGEPGAVAADRGGMVATVGNRMVVAIDRHGRERWSAPVAGASLGWPLLTRDAVIVPTARDDDSGGCVALDRATGARRWADERPGTGGVAVARAGGRAICAMSNGVIDALDLTTGVVRRRVTVGGTSGVTVAISDRTALAVDEPAGILAFTARVGSHWRVVLRDLTTGADRGGLDLGTGAPPSAPVSVGPGRLAVAAGDPAELVFFDLGAGRVVTTTAVDAPNGFDPASIPLAAGGVLVVAGRDGTVTAIDVVTRRRRWQARAPGPILDSRPVAAGAVVLLADWTRQPLALRLADGREAPVPAARGWVVAAASDPSPARGTAAEGFDVAWRSLAGGRIERWVVGADRVAVRAPRRAATPAEAGSGS